MYTINGFLCSIVTLSTVSHNRYCVLCESAYCLPKGTGGSVQVVQDIPVKERWRKICANLILASRQGFGELKTEQLGGHSQEQQRHQQAPIDDDDDSSKICI